MIVSDDKVLCEIIYEVFGDSQKHYADHLAKSKGYKHISQRDLIQFVAQSPYDLAQKYEWFLRLADAYPIFGDDDLDYPNRTRDYFSFAYHRNLVRQAINELEYYSDNDFFVFETWSLKDNEPFMYGWG